MTPRQKGIIAILAAANVVVILSLVMLARGFLSPSNSPPQGGAVGRLPSPPPADSLPSPPPADSFPSPPPAGGTEGGLRLPRLVGMETCLETAQWNSAQVSGQAVTQGALARDLQWRAARCLAQAELVGAATLTPDGVLRFEIIYPLVPGQAADDAAQSVWTVFDIALALKREENVCRRAVYQAYREGCAVFTWVEVTVLALGAQADTRICAAVSAMDVVAFGAGELSEEEFVERVIYVSGTDN